MSVCNRDCFNCPYEDCICDEMNAEDYRAARAVDEFVRPKTAREDAIAAYKREYREANKDAIAAYKREYREANKDAIAAYQREYREANREAYNAYMREYMREYKRGVRRRKLEGSMS